MSHVALTLIAAFALVFSGTARAQVEAQEAEAKYDHASTIQLEGTLAKLAFAGKLEATLAVPGPDERGETQEWTVDFGDTSARELRQAGIRLSPGDKLIVTGNPHDDPESHRILIITMTMPDGSTWSR